jgi:lysophospholipase L1-like esterase
LAAPLTTFARISGEPANVTNAAAQCAPNKPWVHLPTQNLAISGARTGEALSTTPELQPDPLFAQLYARTLPPGATQVSAMEQQNPKFVSVELGANDILGVHSGIAIEGVSMTPFSIWSAQYNQVLDRVAATAPRAVLVGFGIPAANLSSLRRGNELWADRAAFLSSFHVDVSADCGGSTNLIVVPVLVVGTVATGLARRAGGLSPAVLSCTPGSPVTQDRILSAAEEATANAQLALMDAHIQSQANARGFAHFQLGALYNLPKPRFSVVTLMSSTRPYGPFISLDGLHPSGLGQTVLALAAARAIDARYNLGLNTVALESVTR